MSKYQTTVGIEVHVELKTKSKMFCGCKNDPHASKPNSNICPVCTAQPGTLPVVNKEAVEFVLRVGSAIGAKLADFSEFDRKNYFYPDIPKAYQISQYAHPLVLGGNIAGVNITRIHLEEDTARSQHTSELHSHVDFNRAGVPLMELVTEPVIHDSKTAGDFTRELQLLMRLLGVSDANMERGEMRVEANISVSNSRQLGTKVEVKNLNSFKSMEAAIDYETKRHIDLLENGGEIKQETRGWNEQKQETYLQRSKESANDYRYFPDPDITKFKLGEIKEFSESRLVEKQPILAPELRIEFRELGLNEVQIETLLADITLLKFYQTTLIALNEDKIVAAQTAANYLTSDVLSTIGDIQLLEMDSAQGFAALIVMVVKGQINSRTAKDLLKEVLLEVVDPALVAKERGLMQDNSADAIGALVKQVIAENPTVVVEYKAGKQASLQYLVGQGMKASRGTANPQLLSQIFIDTIG